MNDLEGHDRSGTQLRLQFVHNTGFPLQVNARQELPSQLYSKSDPVCNAESSFFNTAGCLHVFRVEELVFRSKS